MSEWYTEDVQKALEIIGGVEWERDSTYTERICHRYGKWVVQRRPVGSEAWETLGFGVTYICHALIEKALREWLEARGVAVVYSNACDREMDAAGNYWHIEPTHSGGDCCHYDTYLAALAAAVLAVEKDSTP